MPALSPEEGAGESPGSGTGLEELDGRSFGTNMMEAALVAISGKGRPLTDAEMQDMLAQLHYTPSIVKL